MTETSEKHVNRTFFHIDLDAFYASVEQRDHPELKGKPVIIGALPGRRGVVAACSYEARRFGIHSAMPISRAYPRCPHGVYLRPRMERYQEVSRTVMSILREFTPEMTQLSVDEATLDMTGTERLLGEPSEAARMIKKSVGDRCDLSISIGIAPNRYLAKLASEYDKPDGLCEIAQGNEEAFVEQLELHDLWGLGDKTLKRLTDVGITSIHALRSYPPDLLQAMVGNAAGTYLYRVVRGLDPGFYSSTPRCRSISSEVTFEHDTRDPEAIRRVLLDLSHQVMFRLLDEGFSTKTVQLKLRLGDFTTTSAQTTLPRPVGSAEEIYSVVQELFEKRWNGRNLIRLVGVGTASLFQETQAAQSELFEQEYDRKKRVEEAVLGIMKKHSRDAVVKASLLRKRRDGSQEDPST